MSLLLLSLIIILVSHYCLETASSLLDLQNLRKIPVSKTGYSREKQEHDRMIEYQHATTLHGLANRTLILLATLVLLLTGGLGGLDTLIRKLSASEVINGILLITLLLLSLYLLNLPFNLYRTFSIEARFDFNRTTPKVFISDQFKGLVLFLLLGLPLIGLILYFFQQVESGWLVCWALTILFSLFVQFVAPVWIMPLFNRFSPLSEGEHFHEIQQFCEKEKIRIAGVFVMDGSKRSSKANAFFTGFGPTRKIVLFDTLLDLLSPKESLAVLAHEIGHYRCSHIPKMFVVSSLSSGLTFYLLSLFLEFPEFSHAIGFHTPSIYGGLLAFSLFFTPFDTLASIIVNLISRKHEFEADHFASSKTGLYQELATALTKLNRSHLSHPNPHPLSVALHYSHPPLTNRIARLQPNGA